MWWRFVLGYLAALPGILWLISRAGQMLGRSRPRDDNVIFLNIERADGPKPPARGSRRSTDARRGVSQGSPFMWRTKRRNAARRSSHSS